jgi:hypothetical protein
MATDKPPANRLRYGNITTTIWQEYQPLKH